MSHQLHFVERAKTDDHERQVDLGSSACKAHVARITHRRRWEKRQQTLRLQQSTLLIQKADGFHNQLDATVHEKALNRKNLTTEPGGDEALALPRRLGPGPLLEHGHTAFQLSHSIPAALCGSGDPFECQIMPVTPRIHQAVNFVRSYIVECWSPSFTFKDGKPGDNRCRIPGFENGSSIGSSTAWWMWKELLVDNAVFWSAIASSMPLLIRSIPEVAGRDMVEIYLSMKSNSLRGLNEAIDSVGSSGVPKTSFTWHVITLFNASCMEGDIVGASYHANVIRNQLECLSITTQQEARFVRSFLWSDSTSALLQLRRPILDYETWLPRMLSSLWDSAECFLSSWEAHESARLYILSPPLIEAFSYVRWALARLELFTAQCEVLVEETELIFHWLTTKAEYHIGCLLNLYDDLGHAEKFQGMSEAERCTESSVALALLHYLQKTFKDVPVDKARDRHDSMGVIYPRLRTNMERAVDCCSQTEKVAYAYTHFWVLYVGTFCEEQIRCGCGARVEGDSADLDQSSASWFHERLAEQGVRLGLTSWRIARPVLADITFNKALRPPPQQWYNETIEGRQQTGS
ncbi:hypothetical protein LTR10_023488 [Elasticomyces elasticus]|uniref:Transcription factor domain-containing protein n=1 Tax=Exophiala sideris TaxID=1016849 RepID=A0ABR0J7X0_9EURO|nr:hypothetical protein LTR10_023488 [Elasticomyces elasticus]KAK5028823.1 hypothetical protein LTS07_006202 [Exophiala sideris]KAK5035692.1 hypothetical protein LTR13_005821 [Exophiala sideris]KAK5057327.1 hypothetical protein LTR69_007366 [Exophiala sideris]KAK5181700.1 hypothetical protein LTR44_005900 [Eurotiomycetes sp. CCFEE 6388]